MNRIVSFFSAAALVGFGAALSGCAEPAFSAHLRDNNVDDISRALSQAGGGAGERRPTAYLLTAGEKHLVRYDLEGAQIAWEVAADVTSRVAVGRGFIAHRQGKGQIAVRNAETGAVRCTIGLRDGEQFLGLAADTRVYYVTQSLGGQTRVSYLVAATPDCSEAWRDEAGMSIGAPAARGDVVAVPYAYQNVVFLDGKTGAELARVRATDEAVSFVRATREGFFYGDNKGIYALDLKSANGSKKGSSYVEAHLASSQIRTFFYWDGYQPSQADYTAFDRNRLLWRADAKDGGGVTFRDAQAILHSYRYFFAFDAATGGIRWSYAHPRVDLMASDDTGPAVVFVSSEGEVGALDAKTGAPIWSKPTGLKVAGATFDAENFSPPGAGPGQAPPLLKTLSDIVTDPDSRFTAVKVFAIGAMTRLPGPEITTLLVKIVTKEGVAPAVAKAASDALIARKDMEAKPAYLDALAVRSDYLNDKRPYGVDVLARLEATIGDAQAAPLLGAHLLDPQTPLGALKEIVKSLVTLGGPASTDALSDFLLSYRADQAFNADPTPLQLAAEGLLKLAGADGRRTVLFVSEEKRTLPSVAAFIRKALDDAGRADAMPAAPAPAAPKAEKK